MRNQLQISTLPNNRRMTSIIILLSQMAFVIAFSLWGGPFGALAQGCTPTVQEIRALYPSEWQVPHPVGVAYSTHDNHFFLLDASKTTSTTLGGATVVVITPYEELIGTVQLTFAVDDAINIAFDDGGQHLLLLNQQQARLASVALNANGLPDPATERSFDISLLGLTSAQGIDVDGATGRLFVLDGAAATVVSAILDPNSGIQSATIVRTDLSFLGAGVLRGIAIHPAAQNLYLFSNTTSKLYQLTTTGRLITTYDLTALALQTPAGFTFAPSSDLTDYHGVIHLFFADSQVVDTPVTTTTLSATVANKLYLPMMASTENQTNQIATEPHVARENEAREDAAAQLFGQISELKLDAGGCGNSAPQILSITVSKGIDDAEEHTQLPDKPVDLYSSDLELTQDGDHQTVGLRFTNVTIPRKAIILDAAIVFTVDEKSSNTPTSLLFSGQAAGEVSPFAATSANLSSRPLTQAAVSWSDIPPWSRLGDKYKTPNLAAIVQEIVNHSDWHRGNNLAFIITGDGKRTAAAHESSPANAPQLIVQYMVLNSPTIAPAVETDPVPHSADAADDSAIWVNPADPSRSTIIGTDKLGGLAVYELTGKQLQYLAHGGMNNVDLRAGFPLNGQAVALVAASNVANNSLALYQVNPDTRLLENVAARLIPTALAEPVGLCMYHSPVSNKYYALINDKVTGDVVQWELFDNGAEKVEAMPVRTFTVGAQVEGCVTDDELGALYIAAEEVGIWKYSAEPNAGAERILVDTTGVGGHLTADVEGLTIYYAANGAGYLLASSQGNSTYVVYQRSGNNDYVTTFTIQAGNGIDGVTETDGIDVINLGLGPVFPLGLFVVQDDVNNGANQNFKLVPWEWVAASSPTQLLIDPRYTK